MRTYIRWLRPGTRFRLADMPEVTGTLISVSDCSATVRVNEETRTVAFQSRGGVQRRFTAHRAATTTWAPTTVVEPIFTLANEEEDMAKQKTAAEAAAPKQATKKMSAIDAAVVVLAKSKVPMSAKEMIEAMEREGLWKSPGGKTPHNTLYSAILREIATAGKKARFVKADRGKFTLSKAGD